MSYCVNPDCPQPKNPIDAFLCQACGARLLVRNRYRVTKSLGQGGFGATFVAIDVETTGLEAGTDEIIEVAAVKFTGDTVLETFQKLIKPRHSLPLKIARLTNISDEMLADAPRFSEVAPELVRFVKSYPLVGHSVGFDLKMLQAQGMRFPSASTTRKFI